MKWADKKLRFARPVQWFLALCDSEVVPFEIEGIASGNKSRGHRFFGKEFEVSNVEEYFTKIRENNVIIDIEERRALVKDLVALPFINFLAAMYSPFGVETISNCSGSIP